MNLTSFWHFIRHKNKQWNNMFIESVFWLKPVKVLLCVVYWPSSWSLYVCNRCYPSWLWVLEWMMSSSSLMPSVRPDRTRGSHSRWSKHPTHSPVLSHPLCRLISSIEECVKACLCLWCSIKQPMCCTLLSKQCSILNMFLFWNTTATISLCVR